VTNTAAYSTLVGTTKPFTGVINVVLLLLRVIVTASHFNFSPIFGSKGVAYPSDSTMILLRGYAANIRLACKQVTATDTLAYNTAILITTVKSFTVQGTSLL
jgi:hypothetical protein